MEHKSYDYSNFDELRQAREARRSRSEAYIQEESKKHKKNDYLAKLILIQAIVCAVIVLLTFAVKKISPSSFEQLRAHYNRIMSSDMSMQEIWESVKSVSAFIILPSDEWKNSGTATTQGGQATTQQPEQEEDTSSDTQGSTKEHESLPDESLSGAGGEDLDALTAAANTSFAPFFVTADVNIPVKGRITSHFGYRIHPTSGKLSFHTGIDIAAKQGVKIAAAFYGTVKEVGNSDSGGNYILVNHQNGLQTLYCHCSEILVEEGMVIRPGETIALVGSTGDTTGPHLHFEVRIKGVRCNPEYILKIHDDKI
ncbi:MAG: M23 family metallopeptidase [Clostridiales bacterium]|jgi:murein DD-endopeptidase MepM/ murein hydrolase activator NlpD|nr:M23 family metallopeptidase [Clostridiales bacterium]